MKLCIWRMMMKKILKKLFEFIERVARHHIGAYAAQSAFFLVLSLIPIILLLLTLVQYTPLTKADIMTAAYEVFPVTIRTTIVSIINEVYNQSTVIIPVTAIVAIWSAGRGTMAISNGLNSIHGQIETRNYFFVRIRAAFYTILLIVAIILCLLFLGFGNSISLLLNKHIPVVQYATQFIIEIRTIVALVIIFVLSVCVYRFLPNTPHGLRNQWPGAIFTAFGWIVASYFISVYMDIFKGFSNMYGSLTTIVLIMLWFYFCMYILLLGGEINLLIEEWLDNRKQCDRI